MRQITVIFNPCAGSGQSLAELRETLATTSSCESRLVVARSWQESFDAARAAADRGAHVVAAAGGDGTVNAVANGILYSDSALGVIPLGSANDFARELSIPFDFRGAWSALVLNRTMNVDVIRVDGWHFVTCGGIGLPSNIAARVQTRNRRIAAPHATLSSMRYLASTAIALLSASLRPYPIRMLSSGFDQHQLIWSLIVANQSRLGRHFVVASDADNRDGLMDVSTIEAGATRYDLALTVGSALWGGYEHRRNVHHFRTKNLQVNSPEQVSFFGDGEPHLVSDTFCIEVLPHCLKVICGTLTGTESQDRVGCGTGYSESTLRSREPLDSEHTKRGCCGNSL